MKKFEIKAKGTLTQYIKDNAIKAKGEISNTVLMGASDSRSCFAIEIPKLTTGLSVSL